MSFRKKKQCEVLNIDQMKVQRHSVNHKSILCRIGLVANPYKLVLLSPQYDSFTADDHEV
jgi:hypothetical protein